MIASAMRRVRTFDEVEGADFAQPTPIDEATLDRILHGDGDQEAALRRAIHRPPAADSTQGPEPFSYEMLLPPDVDYNFPSVVEDTGNLPYQAVLLRTRQNFGGATWMSQPSEQVAVGLLRLKGGFNLGPRSSNPPLGGQRVVEQAKEGCAATQQVTGQHP